MYKKEEGEKAFNLILTIPPSEFNFMPKLGSTTHTINSTLQELLNPTLRERKMKLSSAIIEKWTSL